MTTGAPDTSSTDEPTGGPDAQGPPSPAGNGVRRWITKGTIGFAGLVLSAIVGIVIAWNASSVEKWWTARDPLDATVRTMSTHAAGWSMVVQDRSRLPDNIDVLNDCDQLEDAGLAAGGLGVNTTSQSLVLTGVAKGGATILNMTAVVDARKPPMNGAFLECPTAGGVEPLSVKFDLSTGQDSAQAQSIAPGDEANWMDAQFTEGFVVDVQQDEPVSFAVETLLPGESIEWHIEAEIRVNGETRTIRIDDEGKNFISAGQMPGGHERSYNSYEEGHGGGVSTYDWGLDPNAGEREASDGSTWLTLGEINFPYIDGLNFYQPILFNSTRELGGKSTARLLRMNSTSLLEVYPGGDIDLPNEGAVCTVEGMYDANGKRLSGSLRLLAATPTTKPHEVTFSGKPVDFIHTNVIYGCSQGRRDGSIGTAEFEMCQGIPCLEQQQIVQVVQNARDSANLATTPAFVVRTWEIPEDQRHIAQEMLDKVMIGYTI